MRYADIGGAVVPVEEIIGIFDLDNTSSSLRTREFLRRAQQDGSVKSCTDDLPRSFVLCGTERERVWLSALGSPVLKKRAEDSEQAGTERIWKK